MQQIASLALLMALCGALCGRLPAAEMQYPLGVAATKDGVIYVADRALPGVWKIAGGKLELYFQASKKFRTPLNAVRCLAVDGQGRLYAGDSATREVYRFNAEGKPEPLTEGAIGIPMAIAFRDQEVIVCDLEPPHRVLSVPAAGGAPKELARVRAPRGVAVDPRGRIWVVTHDSDRQVVRIAADGSIESVVKGRPFEFPQTIALDEQLNAYVADGYAHAVWKIGAEGPPKKLADGKPLVHPDALCWLDGKLLVVDPRARMADPAAKGLFTVTLDGQVAPLEFANEP